MSESWPSPIPVSERLPEDGQSVLAIEHYAATELSDWFICDFHDGDFWHQEDASSNMPEYVLDSIAYWLPLPSAVIARDSLRTAIGFVKVDAARASVSLDEWRIRVAAALARAGHVLQAADGAPDFYATECDDPEILGGHNGPACIKCGESWCEHCLADTGLVVIKRCPAPDAITGTRGPHPPSVNRRES